jgi:TolB-like protein/Flp pilus assembly protein TadD
MAQSPSHLPRLFAEMKRRKVFRVMAVYGATAFVVLQVADLAFPLLNLPEWTVRLVLVLSMLGFPIAMVLAWAFEQTPEGLARTEEASESEIEEIVSAPASQRLPAGLLAVAGVVLLFGGGWWIGRQGSPGGELNPASVEGAERIRSIAVLPFTTRAAEADEEAVIFSDGMHDDLLTQLSKIGSLKVISRTSVMSYRDNPKPMPEIGAELGVETVLEGSVDRVGGRVRVNMQLIDAETDEHLWGETYDEELTTTNLFAIRSDLVKQVAAALEATLTPEVEARIEAQPTEDLEAYNLYTRGRYFWNKRTRDGIETAIEYFRQAIELDSSYAAAYAGIADSYSLLANYNHMPRDEALPLARGAAERALELDENLAEAHTALAYALAGTNEWVFNSAALYYGADPIRLEEAESRYQRAIALNPSYATAHHWYGVLLWTTGRPEEALDEIRRAHELDPLSGTINVALAGALRGNRRYLESLLQADRTIELMPDLGSGHFAKVLTLVELGQLDEALVSARRAAEVDLIVAAAVPYIHYLRGEYEVAANGLHRLIELRPDDPWNYRTLAWVETTRGRYDEAFAAWERENESAPADPFNPVGIAVTLAAAGRADEARAILADMERLREDPAWPQELRSMAEAHAALGDYDRAFELLDEAVAANTEGWALRTDPDLDPLRGDSRFEALLERAGLDDASVDSIMARYRDERVTP